MESTINKITTKEIVDFFTNKGVINYVINPDMSVNIYENYRMNNHNKAIIIKEAHKTVSLRDMKIDKLPKCPDKIGWDLLININKLKTLSGLPKYIMGNLYMMHNQLEHSQENFEILYDTYIGGDIVGDDDFMVAYNRYKTIRDITTL